MSYIMSYYLFLLPDRRALCSTTIVTAASTVLLPEQTLAAPACSISNSTLTALPTALQSTSTALVKLVF